MKGHLTICSKAKRNQGLFTDQAAAELEDYRREAGSIVIANPNAPTGVALPRAEIARLLEDHPDYPGGDRRTAQAEGGLKINAP